MPSTVGWIDFSSEHRDRVRTALDLIGKPAGVLYELGIGPIRDVVADRLFPGISTIQTRAKYFTLTALLIREYEREVAGKANVPPIWKSYPVTTHLSCGGTDAPSLCVRSIQTQCCV